MKEILNKIDYLRKIGVPFEKMQNLEDEQIKRLIDFIEKNNIKKEDFDDVCKKYYFEIIFDDLI
ncbi:MAG: hypothetical protein GY849_02475 [Deltaproteobacteria bacterium]|nr:hypothetical protein [Deltaproteobacteria bacterium]